MSEEEEWSFMNRKRFTEFASPSQLSPRVRQHLTSMYGHLAVTALLATVACWMQINGAIEGGGLVPAIGGVAAIWSIRSVSNEFLRQSLLYLFGFLEGLSISPIVANLYYLSPQVLISAMSSTALIFLAFTFTALYSPRRSFFYLAGVISSGFLALLMCSLLSIFMDSSIVDSIILYLGLMLFAFLITLDTQVVVERVESIGGDRASPIIDAANMLINIISILRRMLVIAARRAESRSPKKRRDKRQ